MSHSSPTGTIANGKEMNNDMTGSAKGSLEAKFYRGEDELKFALVSLTLDDGTRCQSDVRNMPTGRVLNADDEAFKAEVSGELLCGDAKDKRISFDAMLNEQP